MTDAADRQPGSSTVSSAAPTPTNTATTTRNAIVSGWLLLALIPMIGALLLLLFAWHTSLVFGEWPTYGNPDPKDANAVLYQLTGWTIFASVPSAVGLFVGLTLVRKLRLTKVDVALLGISMLGLVVLFSLFSGNLGDWYID